MCIIAYSPYGEKIKNNVIKNCFLAHSDGAGIMFRCSSGIAYIKGIMDIPELKKRYKEMMAMFPLAEHAIHFRTGTSGKDKFGCTHPFPLSDCYFELHTLSGIAKRMLMHNGILGHGDNGLSDTQLYVKDILHPIRNVLKNQPIREMVEDHIGSYNKFLIFDKEESYMLGNWVEDKDGFWYTNSDYLPRIERTSWKHYIVKKQIDDKWGEDWNEDAYLNRWKDTL